MIPNKFDRTLVTNAQMESRSFGLSTKDEAHLLSILRDSMYSDKVLAVLREYAASAWDAHRDNGKKDLPIQVTIPTSMKPVLEIRDYGTGLSHDDVFNIYTQYGASTKRDSDETVGSFGIGSKSGFAYTDTFTIISRHKGVCRTYAAIIDESEKGAINLLDECPCGEDESGITIQIAVKPNDIYEFQSKATRFFRYFEPQPTINVQLPPPPAAKMRLTNGVIYEEGDSYNHSWLAVMGCVSYRVNLDQLSANNNNGKGIAKFISGISGALFFDIGEIQVSASREELKYSAETRAKLIEKFDALVDEYVMSIITQVESDSLTDWEKRNKAQVLRLLDLPIPAEWRWVTEGIVQLTPPPVHFTLAQVQTQHGRRGKRTASLEPTSNLGVAEGACIVVKDDNRLLAGFTTLDRKHYMLRVAAGATEAMALAELATLLKLYKLSGITITRTSVLPWVATGTARKTYARRTSRVLKLKPSKHQYAMPLSQYWDELDHTEDDSDVYVVLESFRSVNFYDTYQRDSRQAELLGFTMPTIIGYRQTVKNQIDTSKLKGTGYFTWRKKLAQLILANSQTIAAEFDNWMWERSTNDKFGYSRTVSTKECERVASLLGKQHEVSDLLQKTAVAHCEAKKLGYDKKDAFAWLLNFMPEGERNPTVGCFKQVHKKYHLFSIGDVNISTLWGKHWRAWVGYIKLVDSKENGQ